MKMKKYVFVALSLTGLILLIAFGCDKEEEVPYLNTQESNTLVFEDPSLKDEVSPNFYDNHIYRIEVLGENQEKNRVLKAASESGADISCLNVTEIQKCYFNHTELIMYSIPGDDPEKALILYERYGLFQVSLAEYHPLEGERNQYSLKTLDDELYFSFQLDDQNWIGEFEVRDNEIINSFNNQVYAVSLEEGHVKSAASYIVPCCRKQENWSACVNCTLDALEGRAFFRLAIIASGPTVAAAIAASCIGAGPDARC